MAHVSVSPFVRHKQSSPEHIPRNEVRANPEALTNGKLSGSSHAPQHLNFSISSPKSPDFDDDEEEEHRTDTLDRSNRRRQRPQRYSKEFVEAVSDNDANFDTDDDDIVGEAVYNEEYLWKLEQRKNQNHPPEKSSSPGQEEVKGTKKRRFLDLNELAQGFDDYPDMTTKGEACVV
ncbi:unnamed protein product [Lupinus luteus]|uniref:Uncharacterized protein n=1 Tax=Lupinus luteus TaxID=3873 RepID=A0AAV1W6Z2_LUPLU